MRIWRNLRSVSWPPNTSGKRAHHYPDNSWERSRENERHDLVFCVAIRSTLSEIRFGALGTIYRLPEGRTHEPCACRNHPPHAPPTSATLPGRSLGARCPRKERGIARAGGLAEPAEPERLAGRKTAVQRLQPPPSVSPQPARSGERRIESRSQAGRVGGRSACAGWVRMMNGWSRASEASGSTCR